ncbi:23S rRNA (guanosine(2251)-2'-O)-methyltransferase RlmB [Marinicauda algicola]|uniref:23S rRNA (Guanosine(2251)-2'-O)-methyltransferase RlmB n=1 Tax=Marinicauda algicola TaxID=2029849 RepID=A0A4S2H3U6_9PROT|nr:23S rRNA (guanosine(2251)-2'-O)-methyltransferase RlmB [Marinicauda algicola]TGY89942.1 23S rRNA (guanosine(2251)-2'-O)-methyltransferase RlmB [Marinicauda algicola]
MAPERRNTPKKPDAARSAGKITQIEEGWIWGRHAVLAALANPRREIRALYVSQNAARDLPEGTPFEMESPDRIARSLPEGAVHQGFAARAAALEPAPLRSVADPTHGLLVVLDQITDPHNVGAIFRSAAAFGARAIVMQDRKSPPLFGTVCKSAVGTTEAVDHVRVVNIADTLKALREEGRVVLGLAGEATLSLADAVRQAAGPGLVLVLGAEDKGLRPRVAEHCDALVRIPMSELAESLNVSTAAAVALYEASRYNPRINPPR